MKFWMMNAWAAVLGSTPGKFGDELLDLAQLIRIEVAGLDERHQAGRDGGEDQGREGDGAQQEPVAQQVAPFLDEDGPDEGEPHRQPPRRAATRSSRTPASPTSSR